MVTLIIQGKLDGLGAEMKKANEKFVSAYIMRQLRGVHFDGVVRLMFRWYEENKKHDLDNIAIAKRCILDALVSNGVIVADGWRSVEGFNDEFYIDDAPRIEVDIQEVQDRGN